MPFPEVGGDSLLVGSEGTSPVPGLGLSRSFPYMQASVPSVVPLRVSGRAVP